MNEYCRLGTTSEQMKMVKFLIYLHNDIKLCMYVGDNKVIYEVTKSFVNNDWNIKDHLVEEYSFDKLDKPFFFCIHHYKENVYNINQLIIIILC